MKINFAETIREVLDDRNPVTIAGLGTIVLEQVSASFGDQRETMLPPRMRMRFSEKQTPNRPILKWLAQKYNINQKEAEKALKQFSENVLNAFVNYGKVNVPGVAYLYKNTDQTINCEGDKSFLQLFYSDLPKVPIQIFKESLSSTVSVGPVSQSKEAGIEESIVAIKKTEPSIDKPEKKDNTIHSKVIMNQNLDEVKSKYADVWNADKKYNHYDDENGCGFVSILIMFLALMAVLLFSYYGCNKLMELTSTKDDVHAIVDKDSTDFTIDTSIDNFDLDSISGQDLVDSMALIPADIRPDRCVIITGVFGKARNVLKMQDILSRDGYEVYKEVNGGMTRIGIIFNCQNIDLVEYLQNIRRSYSAKAWYLRPELYVEYEY